jgi:hypothetical protein
MEIDAPSCRFRAKYLFNRVHRHPGMFTPLFTPARFSRSNRGAKFSTNHCAAGTSAMYRRPVVRSTPESGHVRCKLKCPLWAKSGHQLQQVHTNQMAVHVWQCRFRKRQIGSCWHDRSCDSYSILAGIVSITSPVTGSILRTGDAAPCARTTVSLLASLPPWLRHASPVQAFDILRRPILAFSFAW